MQSKYKYLIGNERWESKDAMEVKNPYNNEIVSTTFLATERDVNDAIQAAVRTYASHKDTQRSIESLLGHSTNICLMQDLELFLRYLMETLLTHHGDAFLRHGVLLKYYGHILNMYMVLRALVNE